MIIRCLGTFDSSLLEYGGERDWKGPDKSFLHSLGRLSFVKPSPASIIFYYLIEQRENNVVPHLDKADEKQVHVGQGRREGVVKGY